MSFKAVFVPRHHLYAYLGWLAAALVTVMFATPADAQTPSGNWEYCVEGETPCFPSMEEAEAHMRSLGPAHQYLEPVNGGRSTNNNSTLIYTTYAVKPKPIALLDDWYDLGFNNMMVDCVADCSDNGVACKGGTVDGHVSCPTLDHVVNLQKARIAQTHCNVSSSETGSYATPFYLHVGSGNPRGADLGIMRFQNGGSPTWIGRKVTFTYTTCPTGPDLTSERMVLKFVDTQCPPGLNRGTGTAVEYGGTARIATMCTSGIQERIIGRLLQFDQCPKVGNPCVPTTGNKIATETDISSGPLSFQRHYNSLRQIPGTVGLGVNWTHTYSARILNPGASLPIDVSIVDEKNHLELFQRVAGNDYFSRNRTGAKITRPSGQVGPYLLQRADGAWQRFDNTGRLIASGHLDRSEQDLAYTYSGNRLTEVGDLFGHTLQLAYENEQLVAVESSDGSTVEYAFNAVNNIESVLLPGGATREYHYEDANLPYQLTGITDENGDRYATYAYDTRGRVISSEHAGGAGRVELDYGTPGQTVVTDALGKLTTYAYNSNLFLRLGQTTDPQGDISNDYTAGGRLESVVDREGNRTDYEYGVYQQTARVDAVATPEQRRSETDWNANADRRVATRTRNAANALLAQSAWTHNTRGQILTQTDTDPVTLATRTTTYAYCEAADVALPSSTCPILGQLKSIDGPRTDVSDITSYTYRAATDASGCATTGPCHRKGDLWTVTNALGHVTETLRYDRAGRVRAAQDPNGVVTEFTWHPRGWLTSRTVKGATAGDDAVTSYTYDAAGQVTRITQPDGDYLDYEYDDAHRLVAIEDALGHRIEYTLDAAGNRTAEVTKDAGAAITRQLSRVYDQLGRLDQQLDAQNRATSFTYDANGNQTGIEDALGVDTRQVYDPLDRLKTTIQDDTGLDIETGYTYDALDRLVTVTDPKGLDTDYRYDGLGNLVELDSPDTGVTTYTYDAAGNRLTQTDARGITATYTYDALDRLTHIAYPTSSLDVSFDYDTPSVVKGCHRTGRLAVVTDASGTTDYCYDRRGNVTRKTLATGAHVRTVEYTYSVGDRLRLLTQPDGLVVRYSHNALGQIVGVAIKPPGGPGAQFPVVNDVDYLPFGPTSQITFAGVTTPIPVAGATLAFDHDQNYWTNGVNGTALNLDFDLDATGNIVAANDPSPANARSYTYDPLARLTDIDDGNAALIEAFTYDGTGNRLSRQTSGGTQTYGYPLDSHRLTSIDAQTRSYDAMGSLTARGADTFVYDDRQRLVSAGSATYTYNARGERASKTVGAVTTLFTYDEAGHLIAEHANTTGSHTPQRGYLWLDDRPVALYVHTGAYANQWLHIHTDHLGTPRAITRPAANDTVVWRWDFTGSAFGDHAPLTDPDGDGTHFAFNLRFPGQYYDAESGLHYNYFRDYEAGTGRYVESDPIGLGGGISTYGYVNASPFSFTDPFGREPEPCCGTGDFDIDMTAWLNRILEGVAGPATIPVAVVIMNNSNMDMRDDNTIGNDKYFHCVGSCEATRLAGMCAAEIAGDFREDIQDIFDHHNEDRFEDEFANATGRSAASSGLSCRSKCAQFIVPGINPEYLPE